MNHAEIRRILIPRFDTLGDIILLEGFLEALLQQFPRAEIAMLVREGYDQLAPLFPERLSWKTTSLNPYKELNSGTTQELAAFLDTVAATAWDLVLFTTYNRTWLDNALAAKLTGTRKIAIGSRKPLGVSVEQCFRMIHLETDNVLPEYVQVDGAIHETEKYQILGNALNLETTKLSSPQLHVPTYYAEKAREFLCSRGLEPQNFFICLPAGTQNNAIKGWSISCFAELIRDAVDELGKHPLIVGHISEAVVVDKLTSLLENDGIKAFAWLGTDGELSVLAALIAKSHFYVGNDTGPMHIAAALNIPVVGIFGGGYWPRFLPVGISTVGVAGDMPCFGCDWNCIFGDAPCVALVTPVDVLGAIRMALNGEGSKRIYRTERTMSCDSALLIEKAAINYGKREADRAARLDVISYLEQQLQESNSDRAERLDVINSLDTQLKLTVDKLVTVIQKSEAQSKVIKCLSKELVEHKISMKGVPDFLYRAEKKRTSLTYTHADYIPAADDRKVVRKHIAVDALHIVFGVSGGVEIYMDMLIRALLYSEQYRVTLLCKQDQMGILRERYGVKVGYYIFNHTAIINFGHKVLSLFSRPAQLAAPVISFNDLREEINIDIVHSPVQLFSSFDFNVPSVLNLHDLQHLHYPEYFRQSDIEARNYYYGLSANLSDAIVASSNFVRCDIIEKMNISPAKVFTVPVTWNPAIEPGIEHITPATARSLYNLPELYAFYPAQFWLHKNHNRLIEAVKIVRDRLPGTDLKLVLTGYRGHSGWPSVAELIDKLDMREHICFLDYVPVTHLAAIYKAAVFTIVPSLFEASSYPVIEAQVLGCPVMCSNVTSLPELVAGGAGVVFDPLSPEDMADNMTRWLLNPEERNKCAEIAVGKVHADHNITQYLQKIDAVYKTISRKD